jgi:hypothetical protein
MTDLLSPAPGWFSALEPEACWSELPGAPLAATLLVRLSANETRIPWRRDPTTGLSKWTARVQYHTFHAHGFGDFTSASLERHGAICLSLSSVRHQRSLEAFISAGNC